VGVKIPVYERDVLLAKIATEQGVPLLDTLNEKYQAMTCAEMKAIAG
jgi:hypothetical protein